jgi:hypothetical protein
LIIPAHRHSRVGEMVNIMANGLKVLDLGCVLKGFKWLEKVTLNCLNMRHSEPDHRATLACKENLSHHPPDSALPEVVASGEAAPE